MTRLRLMRVLDMKEERHTRDMKYQASWALRIAASMAEQKVSVDDIYPHGKGVDF